MLIEKRNEMTTVATFWYIQWDLQNFTRSPVILKMKRIKKTTVVRTQTVLLGRIVS